MQGVLTLHEAIAKAQEVGLDLVEISPNAEPPVCKAMDFGKYKYQQQKKEQEGRKKQKIVHIKEIKLRPTTDHHDYEVKLRSAQKFLQSGDKVKVSLRFRGREITHQEIGMQMLIRMKDDLIELGKAEMGPRMEGRQMIMILTPVK
jgi:translation initiation factor IF-3